MKKIMVVLLAIIFVITILMFDICLGGLLFWGIASLCIYIFKLNLTCTYIQAVVAYVIASVVVALFRR